MRSGLLWPWMIAMAGGLFVPAIAVLALADGTPLAGLPDPELEDALQELDEAGVRLSDAELREILDTPAPATSGRRSGNRGHGDLSFTAEPGAAGGMDPRVRWDARWKAWRVTGRLRRSEDQPPVRGSLRWEPGRQQHRLGDVGLAWGMGLISAGPGRPASLAADARLAPFRCGPVSGGSPGDRQALRGAAAAWALGSWQAWGAMGTSATSATAPRQMRRALGIGRAGPAAQWGLLVMQDAGQSGLGALARFERDHWLGAVEVAGSGHPGAIGWRAVSARAGWTTGRKGAVEAACAAAGGGEWFPTGRRPALLVEDEGSGWALRGSFAPVAGWRLAGVLARARGADSGQGTSRVCRERVEFQARWQPARGWEALASWRRTLQQQWAGSERFPWQPAIAGPQQRRMIWTGTVSRRTGHQQWRIRVRTQSDSGDVSIRYRNFLQGVGSLQLRKWIRLQGSWTTAWGGDADLVSALVPIPGVLLPRHWGHWRTETALGIRLRWRALSCSAAVSRREPEPAPGARPERNGWVGLRVRF